METNNINAWIFSEPMPTNEGFIPTGGSGFGYAEDVFGVPYKWYVVARLATTRGIYGTYGFGLTPEEALFSAKSSACSWKIEI